MTLWSVEYEYLSRNHRKVRRDEHRSESAEEAEQIASNLESQGAFEMDIQISVEKAWDGGL